MLLQSLVRHILKDFNKNSKLTNYGNSKGINIHCRPKILDIPVTTNLLRRIEVNCPSFNAHVWMSSSRPKIS